MLTRRRNGSILGATVLLAIVTILVLCRRGRLIPFGSSSSKGGYASLLSSEVYPPPPVELEFIHIPKTGGTSIELWGRENGFHWGKYARTFTGSKKSGEFHCNSWHTPQNVSMESFCVVRQPFERLQSEFRHRICGKNSEMPCDRGIFNEWARNVLGGRLDVNDCHVLPQSQYLTACDNVLGFDELQSQFTALLSSRGYNGPDTELEIVKQPTEHIRSDCDRECAIDPQALDEDVISLFEDVYKLDLRVWDIYVDRRARFSEKQQQQRQQQEATTTPQNVGNLTLDPANASNRGSNSPYFFVRGQELAEVARRS